MNRSLKEKTVKATSVLLLGHGSSQIIRFVGNLITTRILAPEFFGVMAIANAIVTVIALLSDMGFTLSIIRSKRGEEPQFLKTIFSLKVLQGLVLTTAILLMGFGVFLLSTFHVFPIDSALNHPDLPKAISIVAFAAIINGWQSVELDLQKRFHQFHLQTVLTLISQVIALTFIIVSGSIHPSIYSLAFSNVIAAVVMTCGSYLLFPRRYFGFAWDKPALREIFHFGKWITASSAMVGVSNNADRFLFGYFFTGTQMGLYAVAALIFQAMDTIFKKMNISLFTAVSEVIRDTPEKISEIYYKIRFFRDLVISLPACLIITNGDLIVKLIYDSRYHASGNFLQLMSIAHLVECFLFKSQVVMAMGNSKLQFKIAAMRLIGLCIMVPIGYYIAGPTGIILSIAGRRLIGSWELFRIFSRSGYLRWSKELRTLAFIIAFLGIGILIRLLAMQFLPDNINLEDLWKGR